MAFTQVQIGANVNGTGSVSLTMTSPSAAGTLLVACLFNTSGAAFTAPGGWQFARAVSQGTVSRTAVWFYPGNPGGISSATFTSSGNCRGVMSEFGTATGTIQAVDQTGSNNGAAPATSFAVTAGGPSAAGDLGIAAYQDSFATGTAGLAWTIPAGYTVLRNQANVVCDYSASYNLSLSSGVQTVTASYPSSANQNGWTGVFVAFSETAASALTVTTTSLPAGKAGVAYQASLAAAGGTPPYTWAVTAGALPAGLSLTASGGRGGLFGVTPYLTGVSFDDAITGFQTLVGRPVVMRKCYLSSAPDQYTTTPTAEVQSCLDLSLTGYLCYKPAYNPPTAADYNSLQAALAAFAATGLKAKVILYQEIEDQALTPAQYKAMLAFYRPAVQAVYPGGLVHDAAGSKPALWSSFFPDATLVDEYGIDFYGTAYASGTRLTAYAALVAAQGKRLGVLEMGTSVGTQAPPSDTVITAYLNHINDIAAANPPGGYAWYEQQNKNPNNVISSSADFRIPLLQQISDTIAGNTAAGTISGTPTAGGTSSFTARVTDNNAATATAALSITITAAAPPVITTTSLPAATVGVAYSQQLALTGGTAPFTWAVTAGVLPDGLALDPSAGLISGTPAPVAATSSFTITVTDGNAQAGSQVLTITVVTSLTPGGFYTAAYGDTYGAAPGPAPAPAVPQLAYPQVIIEAGLAPAAPQVPAGTFILDDPVYGKLDSGNKLADSAIWTDIAAYFRSGTTIRPSTRVQGPLLAYQGGTATAVFDNADGRFDPDNTSGSYAGALRPMIPVRIRAVYGSVSYDIWAGFITSWAGADLTYDMGYDEATLTADDGFKVLAGITIPAVPLGSDGAGDGDGEDSGARVTRILNAAGWYTDHRRISAGDSTVQGTLYGDTALNLLQLTADSEIGELYIDGAGNLVFRHRQAILEDARSAQVQAVFGDLPGTVHGGTGTGAYGAGAYGGGAYGTGGGSGGGFTELACIPHRRATDDTTLANDIQAARAGGILQEAKSRTSQRTYLFPRSYARDDLLLEDDLTVKAWAQWVLAVSLTGDDRFESVTIDPIADPANLFPQVLARDVGDRIQVWRRPQNSGITITQDCFIRGIQHDVDAVAGTWSTTWTLQGALRYTGFLIVGDPVYGLLGTGKLAF